MKRKTARSSLYTILLLTLLAITNFAVIFLNHQLPRIYADPSWLDGWSYRRELTVDNTLIDADLTDFPVLVKLESSFFDFTKAQGDGEDIRFTGSDGTTLLKYEIERWDDVAEKAEVWVKLPAVSSTSDTDFYLYYGNPTASDAQDPTNVWDSNFMMVHHLEETSGTHYDSTSSDNDSTIVSVTTQGSATGKIGGADEFVRTSSNYVTIGDSGSINLLTYTLELWFKADDASVATQALLGRGEDWTNDKAQWIIELDDAQSPDKVQLWYEEANDNDHYFPSTTSISSGMWYYVAATREQSSGRVIVYLQGVSERDVVDATTPWSGPTPVEIGCRRNDGGNPIRQDYFGGIIDEVRVSDTPRTAAWIKATYHSEDDALLTYGSEETITGAPTFSNIAANTTRAGDPCEFQVKWSDPDGLDICLFTTNNTGTWQPNQTITVSGTESWANITKTLNTTAELVIGFRWYCNDTLGNMEDTGIQTLTTTGDWQYAMKLWFNNTAIGENLVDFPVMINLGRAGPHFWSHTDPNHKDLRFVDADNTTELYFEVEYWNYAEQEAYVWVKVPQIDASSATDFIYLYYANPESSESPYHSPTQVWDSSFVMVQHLEEPSGTVTDSTSYGNDGTYSGATQGAAGKIDGAYEFDGVDDYVAVSHDDSLNLGTGDFTISVWVKYPDTGPNNDADIMRKGNTQNPPGNNYKLELSSNRIAGNLYDGGNSRVETTATYGDDNWHFVVFRRESASIYLYVDGGLEDSETGAGRDVSNTAALSIGSKNPPQLGDHFDGIIDELRVSNTSRSVAWLNAEYLSTSDQYVTFTRAPNKPANPNPPDGAVWISTSPTLSVDVTDPDGDPMDVYFYQAAAPAEALENFTIIVLPDTQYYSESYPTIFDSQTQWIVDNAESMNIVFVTHEGDIVEHWNVATEWENADGSLSILDDNVPYGFCAGNHDEETTNGDWIGDNYFPESRYASEDWWIDGYVQNKNNAQNFTISGMTFIVIHIEYLANSTTLDWVNSTLQTHAEKRAILTTHNSLTAAGERTAWGQTLWDDIIVPNDNVFMVLCGHIGAEARRTDTIGDRKVHQMLANYQTRTNGGNGWLRILEFSPAEDTIYVKTYSPYLDSYETDADSQFTLDYAMAGPTPGPTLIGVDTDVASGDVASIAWTGLTHATTYRWYAIAMDTHGAATQSDTWNFTTLPLPWTEDLLGDANDDGCVTSDDLILLMQAYGSEEGDSNWNERCDFNSDKTVDVTDLFLLCKNYGKCRRGSGVLYVYADDSEIEQNADANYLVYPGATYNFTIANITEYENTQITVWARYVTDHPYNILIDSFDLGPSPSNITFEWTIPPNLPVTTSIKFKYGTDWQGPIGTWYYARKDVSPSPRLLLVIPEIAFGSLGALIALFIGFKLRAFIKKKKVDR